MYFFWLGLSMFVYVVELLSCSIPCLACNLLSTNIGADTNIGRMSPSHGGGGNSVGTIAGNMGIGNWRGNNMGSNIVVSGSQRSSNMVVGGGQRGDNMVVGGGQRSSNMAVGGQRGCNVVVGGGQRRGNSIGGSKRSNNIGGSIGWDSVVDKSWVSLSISLTLDNVLNGTFLAT